MNRAIKILLIGLSILIGWIVAFWLNSLIEDIVIPDPCAWHGEPEPTSVLFNTFYRFWGGHPNPTLFNYLFTLGVGTASGIWLSRLWIGWGKKKNR